jgi:N-acetylated-alpha-linked acidic dipeptidase
LLKAGWRPRRTIVYCAWDGEEPVLLGSTEWAEAHAEELQQHAVAYVNSDANGRGYLGMAGSHTLEALVNGIARDVDDPEAGISVWRRRQAHDLVSARDADTRRAIRQRADLRLDPLGSGSDYTAFVDHLGIASLSLGYGDEDDGGIYHSIYDSFYWYTHFSDGDFVYGRALAQTAGLAVLRLADAPLLPFEFTGFAETMAHYLDDVKKLLQTRQEEIGERNRQIEEGLLKATIDPRRPEVVPAKESLPPHLDFAPLERAIETIGRSAERYRSARAGLAGRSLPPDAIARVNEQLMRSERALTSTEGLPGRPWYRHLIYAPGTYAGYGAKTLPGVREAIELKRYEQADRETGRIAAAIADLAGLLDSVVTEIESATAR